MLLLLVSCIQLLFIYINIYVYSTILYYILHYVTLYHSIVYYILCIIFYDITLQLHCITLYKIILLYYI